MSAYLSNITEFHYNFLEGRFDSQIQLSPLRHPRLTTVIITLRLQTKEFGLQHFTFLYRVDN